MPAVQILWMKVKTLNVSRNACCTHGFHNSAHPQPPGENVVPLSSEAPQTTARSCLPASRHSADLMYGSAVKKEKGEARVRNSCNTVHTNWLNGRMQELIKVGFWLKRLINFSWIPFNVFSHYGDICWSHWAPTLITQHVTSCWWGCSSLNRPRSKCPKKY